MKHISFKNDILPLKNQLFRLALRITTNRAEAEDIVQETLIKVWNKREQWDEIASMEAFCFTICRNKALDSIKKHSAHDVPLEEQTQVPSPQHYNPYDDIIHKNRLDLVKQIVNELPEKQRSCMQLRDFEGKTYKDIALLLELTEEQVKINIYRARQAVKQRFLELENYGL